MLHGITAGGIAGQLPPVQPNLIAVSIMSKVVAWWEHSETSGTNALDSHPGGFNGTYNGSFTLASLSLGAGMPAVVKLNANTAFVNIPHHATLNLAQPFEAMLWVRRDGSQATFPKLLCKPTNAVAGQGTYYFQQDNSGGGGRVVFRSTVSGTNRDANSTTTLANTTTYMVNGKRNAAAGSTVYVNTVAEGTNTNLGAPATGSNAIRQGQSDSGDGWVGWIGATALFNAELTDDERSYLYNAGAGVSYATLKAEAESFVSGSVRGAVINETYQGATLTVVHSEGEAPYTWSVVSGALPAGLSLGSSTGQITGVVPTGTTRGYYSFTVQATDSNGLTFTRAYTMGVGDFATLLHLNGADASTTITDATGKTWSASGNAQIDTAQSVYGGASLLLDGTGDFVSCNDNAAHEIGSSDFTVRAHVRLSSFPDATESPTIAGKRVTGQNGEWTLHVSRSTGFVTFTVWDSANTIIGQVIGSTALSLNTWYEVAVSRRANRLHIHINGVLDKVAVVIGAAGDNTGPLRLGRDGINNARDYAGWIDEFQFIAGAAMFFNENYTAQSAASDFPVVP